MIEIEARPRSFSGNIKHAVATELVADLIENGLLEESQREDASRDIAKHATRWGDGYSLMKDLDRYCGWDGSFELCEALNSITRIADEQIEHAQKEWAAKNNIQAPFSVGQRVRLTRSGETGVITGICQHRVCAYLIAIDGDVMADGTTQSRRIVCFEDVEAVAHDLPAS